MKCTSSPLQYKDKGNIITYKLKAKNYNDLCLPATTPIMLGLLILPEDEKIWLHWTREELMLKGCLYWAEFSGKVASVNEGTVNVKIDKKNVVNTETLQGILEAIAREEWP